MLRHSYRQIVTLVLSGAGLAVPGSANPAGAAALDQPRIDADHRLKGVVGPEFTITISESSVPAGTYKVVVKDKGTIHNFHLVGPGIDKKTSVPKTGRTVWTVDLRPGSYEAHCDPHGSMAVTLEVT